MTTLNKHGYPISWPLPTSRTNAVASRITHDQKKALYEREITTRDLAKTLNVREAYLSFLFPGKGPTLVRAKKALLAVRKEYRLSYAKKVIEGLMTTDQAATAARIPYRSMARAVQALRVQGKTNETRV